MRRLRAQTRTLRTHENRIYNGGTWGIVAATPLTCTPICDANPSGRPRLERFEVNERYGVRHRRPECRDAARSVAVERMARIEIARIVGILGGKVHERLFF